MYSLSAITVVEVESTVMAFSTRAGRLDEPGDRRAVHVTEIDREFLRVMRGIGIVDGCVFRSDELTLPSGLGRSLKPLSGPAAFGEEMDLDGPVLSLAEAVLWQMTSLDRPVPAVEVERRSFVEYWENSPRRD